MNEEQNINQLPKEWKWVKLGDVCDRITKGGTPTTYGFKFQDSGIRFLKIENVKNGRVITDSIRDYISEEAHEYQKKSQLAVGDILFSIAGTIGETCAIKEEYLPANTNQAFAIIRGANEKFDLRFLQFQLESFVAKIKIKARGGAMNNVSLEDLKNFDSILPPKPTQLAIVSKIEELFSELDKGIEQLKTAQQQLKIYRQAVLKWAFEGKLTEKWRTPVQIRSSPLELSMAAEPEVEYGVEIRLPEGWEHRRLGDVCDKIQDGSHFSPQVQYDEPGQNRFKYITAKNIRNNYMDFRKVTYVDKDFHDSIFGRCNPEFGDVLLTKDGINTGEVTLNTLHEPFSLLSSVCIFKTKKNDLKSEFLKYFIQSPLGSKAILDSMTGTAIKRIVLRKIKDSVIVLPPVEEQHNIIQEIESRLSVADKMEESITQSLQQAEALRQSILKKAFEGRLLESDVAESYANVNTAAPHERKVLAGRIIYLMHEGHHFGLTKFQKVLYLIENFSQVDYETNYIQERAGPYDKKFTLAFRKEMQEKGWFSEEQKNIITKFIPSENAGSLIVDYAKYFRSKGSKIAFVIQQLMDKSTHDAELVATLYAVWNNRLIKKKSVAVKHLVEDFFNWSPKKKEEFQEVEVVEMHKWMKKVKFVPVGFGKVIEPSDR